MEKLYIVIPSYNEADNIIDVVNEWYKVVEKIGKESRLVIFDGESKDGTGKIVKKMTAKMPQLILESRPKCGHGPTVIMAYQYAIDNKADYVFQTDADGQTLSSEFWQFWENRKKHSAIIGHRNHRKDGLSRIVVTKTLKALLLCIFGTNVTDANTPFRLMNIKLLKKYLTKMPKDFNLPNVMLTVMFLKNKESVKFIPITFRPRQGGKNTINLKSITKIGLKATKDFRTMRKTLKV
ncbi:MAG: glycosyltransferase family 2 protein [Mollicutes bacterium]|nr:glycosyltransferase family 2 protein [Mollicutes bacterium]